MAEHTNHTRETGSGTDINSKIGMEDNNNNNVFKFQTDTLSISPSSSSPLPPLQLSASDLQFASQNDLGKLFATQGSTTNFTENTSFSSPIYFEQSDQHHSPLFRKLA